MTKFFSVGWNFVRFGPFFPCGVFRRFCDQGSADRWGARVCRWWEVAGWWGARGCRWWGVVGWWGARVCRWWGVTGWWGCKGVPVVRVVG